MAASKEEISKWFDEGVKKAATHMIIACDTFDYDDYPVFVHSKQSVEKEVKRLDGVNMQRVMEVYKLSDPKGKQLNEYRAYNL